MSVISYAAVRDEAITQLKTRFPSSIRVEAHPGRFDEAEIKRQYTKAPAILTGMMGIKRPERDDNQTPEFVTWVLVRASNKDRLYDQGLILVSVLVPALLDLDAPWSFGGAKNVDARNLYASSTGQMNVALWAVKWEWNLRGSVLHEGEGGILLPDDLDNFEGYTATLDVGTEKVSDTTTLS